MEISGYYLQFPFPVFPDDIIFPRSHLISSACSPIHLSYLYGTWPLQLHVLPHILVWKSSQHGHCWHYLIMITQQGLLLSMLPLLYQQQIKLTFELMAWWWFRDSSQLPSVTAEGKMIDWTCTGQVLCDINLEIEILHTVRAQPSCCLEILRVCPVHVSIWVGLLFCLQL